MKAYWGMEVQLHALLISALDGGEWSASRPDHFTHREKAPGIPLDRRLGGPQSRCGRGGEEKNSTVSKAVQNTVLLYSFVKMGTKHNNVL